MNEIRQIFKVELLLRTKLPGRVTTTRWSEHELVDCIIESLEESGITTVQYEIKEIIFSNNDHS